MAMTVSLAQKKAALFAASLLPLAYIVYLIAAQQLGIDPVKTLVHLTGDWAIRFLLVTFSITPLRQWLKQPSLLRYRRMLGLFAWFYTSVHFLLVLTYIFGWDWELTKIELTERPYVIVGFLAWLLMVPMGLTSNNYAVRRLRQNWRRLHLLMYPVILLGWLHIAWQARSSYFDAFLYGSIIVVLFLPRLKKLFKSR